MTTPLSTLVSSGTKLWLDHVDPEFIKQSHEYGASGATSNPAIISEVIKSGRFDEELANIMKEGNDDTETCWKLTNHIVELAQKEFIEIYEKTEGNDGFVSFELDPLLEAADCPLSIEERTAEYISSGIQWAENQPNRMIKVPATPAGLNALEELAAAGVTLNVTLIFTDRQYQVARDAVWKGVQKRDSLDKFKSVYSIFVSRVDVYTLKQIPELSEQAQGEVGIVNAKLIWQDNQNFWKDKNLKLDQEMIFASTGTKDPNAPADKYVDALAGSDIQTNPPGTNAAIQKMEGKTFSKTVDQLPQQDILDEISQKVDNVKLENVLMEEGLKKFADPQKGLLSLIAEKRKSLS
jgi:transaldolase